MSNINLNNLSKIISHALRHQPSLYGLELDKDGWVSIDLLIFNIKKGNNIYDDLSRKDIYQMIKSSKKKRHEIFEDKIRASYGHSLKNKIIKESSTPPEYLYHATKKDLLKSILKNGLLPMKRQYVHLSEKKKDAVTVALRKTKKPVLLKINSTQAYLKGVKFYSETNNLWLSDELNPEYLEEIKC